MEDDILLGRYVVEYPIGVGSFGMILKALDMTTNEVVAIKMLDKKKTKHESFLWELRNMKIISSIKTAGFPKFIEHGEDDDNYFLVMDLLGADLKTLCKKVKAKRLTIKTVVMMALQLLERIEVLH